MVKRALQGLYLVGLRTLRVMSQAVVIRFFQTLKIRRLRGSFSGEDISFSKSTNAMAESLILLMEHK